MQQQTNNNGNASMGSELGLESQPFPPIALHLLLKVFFSLFSCASCPSWYVYEIISQAFLSWSLVEACAGRILCCLLLDWPAAVLRQIRDTQAV